MTNLKQCPFCGGEAERREVLLLRLDDLLRLLNAPGDWGYGTKLGELTKLLLIARDDLRENRS